MATFPSINPTYGASKRSQTNCAKRPAGGWLQRLRFGLNTDLKVWSLKFEVSETDADTIETFLEARGGAEHFDWSPPDDRDLQVDLPRLVEVHTVFEQGNDHCNVPRSY